MVWNGKRGRDDESDTAETRVGDVCALCKNKAVIEGQPKPTTESIITLPSLSYIHYYRNLIYRTPIPSIITVISGAVLIEGAVVQLGIRLSRRTAR